MSTIRLNGVSLEHPHGRDRANGDTSKARLSLIREHEKRESKVEFVDLSEDDLVRLLVGASRALAVLRGQT